MRRISWIHGDYLKSSTSKNLMGQGQGKCGSWPNCWQPNSVFFLRVCKCGTRRQFRQDWHWFHIYLLVITFNMRSHTSYTEKVKFLRQVVLTGEKKWHLVAGAFQARVQMCPPIFIRGFFFICVMMWWWYFTWCYITFPAIIKGGDRNNTTLSLYHYPLRWL